MSTLSTQELSNPETPNPDHPETTPAVQAEIAQEQGHQHDHDGHDHDHEASPPRRPTFNPECTREVEIDVPADEVSKAIRATHQALSEAGPHPRLPRRQSARLADPRALRRADSPGCRGSDAAQSLPRRDRRKATSSRSRSRRSSIFSSTTASRLSSRPVFEVCPSSPSDGYQDIKVEKPRPPSPTPNSRPKLERVRDSRSTMEPVKEDRALADGDWAQITFTGSVQQPGEGESAASNAPLSGRGRHGRSRRTRIPCLPSTKHCADPSRRAGAEVRSELPRGLQREAARRERPSPTT